VDSNEEIWLEALMEINRGFRKFEESREILELLRRLSVVSSEKVVLCR
jgi:hypothetical protein